MVIPDYINDMTDNSIGNYDEIKDLRIGRPHVVILGAGASLAALPEGDKNGNKLPLMNNLISIVGLEPLLKKAGISYKSRNFEEIYSEIHSIGNAKILAEIEDLIHNYFIGLELPEAPTIYDHLVLSLREKDLIATFNWDPFLFEALRRNHMRTKLPNVAFLHGNVGIGYCMTDLKTGPAGYSCPHCHQPYTDSKLLYPVTQKGYQDQPFIKNEWIKLRHYLKSAYILTIFGYSAPASDVEAIQLMKEGWGKPETREFEQTEIVDIKEDEVLRNTWDPFIHTHHYETHSNFYDSIVARHPRRSCEATWSQLMDVHFINDRQIPRTENWDELLSWYKPLLDIESSQQDSKSGK